MYGTGAIDMGSMDEWQAAFSVGNPILDAQHRKLLILCNQASACLADTSTESVSQYHLILNDLMDYARIHFTTEEQLLREVRYVALDEQRGEHEGYLVRLMDLTTAAMYGDIDKNQLQRHLAQWWMHHILVSDMQFSSLLRAKFPARPLR